MERWQCQPDGEMFFTHASLIWPVTANNEKLMLKVANPDDDEAHGAGMLRHYNGHGAVRLIRNDGHIQLLERISGADKPTLEHMVTAGEADAATHIICDVIEQLHATYTQTLAQTPLKNLIPFRQRSDGMRKHVNEGRVKTADRPLFHIAYDLCDELIAETIDLQIPLHGDIHHGNILYSSTRGWLAIDPKGILGPRVYEYANALCNPYDASDIVTQPAHMQRQAAIISQRASLDKNLLLQFTFLHAMQCAAWSRSEPGQKRWLACAQTAARLAEIKIS